MIRFLHGVLRLLLPRRFRERHGREMAEVFADAHSEAARHGPRWLLALWFREMMDMAVTGFRLRAAGRGGWKRYGKRGPSGVPPGRRGMTMGFTDDLRYAWKSLTRSAALTLFAAVTLALGIGSATAVFSTLESVVLNPLPYDHGDRMVGIFRKLGGSNAYLTPTARDVELWSGQTDLLESLERWTGRSMTFTGSGDPLEVQAALVAPTYHDFIGREPMLGRRFDDSELVGGGARVLLLSHPFWMRHFGGSADALGATVILDGVPWTVVGVMPPGTLVPGWGLRATDVWAPFSEEAAQGPTPAVGLLREGVEVDALNLRFAELQEREGGQTVGYGRLVRDQVRAGFDSYLAAFMGAVTLLLLIACANVSNLLLFRADARKRETAVRSALGGGRRRLVRQFLLESLILALLGGALGVALSYGGQAAILGMRPSQLDVLEHVSINGPVLLFALVVTLTTGIVFGVVPAVTAGGKHTHVHLRGGVRTEGDVVGRRLRWLLVSGEVALSFALLLGAFAILDTLNERLRTDPGFRADELVMTEVRAPGWRYQDEETKDALYAGIRARLAALPGVAGVSQAAGLPPESGAWFGTAETESGHTLDDSVLFGPWVGPDYFATVGQPILAGRAFTDEDITGVEPVVILGETTARELFPDGGAVGSRFRMGGDEEWQTVVGVTVDVPMRGLSTSQAAHQFYAPFRGGWLSASYGIRVAAGVDPEDLLPLVREVVRAEDADIRVDRLSTAEAALWDSLERERFATAILGTFAFLALLLAAVGLYGVVAQVVGQRTRELGIRIALGARRGSIVSLILRRVGGATAAGIGVGTIMALVGWRILSNRIVDLVEQSPRIYLLTAAALALTALLAAYGPTRRAARVDPVDAMRVE